VAVVLTLVQTKQIRIYIHKGNNTKNRVQTIQSTENTSTRVTKTHTATPTIYKATRTHTHTLQNKLKQRQYKLKQTQYKIYPIEIVTI
jgi:ribulose 1,5-bisphosphate carboxylase large subunit-like protein